jgi:Uncharacterized small protein (DUF2158)
MWKYIVAILSICSFSDASFSQTVETNRTPTVLPVDPAKQTKSKFEVGDVVRLKSGGVLMTVIDASEPVKIIWSETKEDVLRSMTIPSAALVKAETSKR